MHLSQIIDIARAVLQAAAAESCEQSLETLLKALENAEARPSTADPCSNWQTVLECWGMLGLLLSIPASAANKQHDW